MCHFEIGIFWEEFNKEAILKHEKDDIEPMEDITVP